MSNNKMEAGLYENIFKTLGYRDTAPKVYRVQWK